MSNITVPTEKNQLEKIDKDFSDNSGGNICLPNLETYSNLDDYWKDLVKFQNSKVEANPSPNKPIVRNTVKERKPIDIKPWADVKFTKQGDIYGELLYMEKGVNHKATIKPLDKERYQVVKTGEIRFYNENESKSKDNLAKTFRELVGILRANFTAGRKNQVFLTLTYQENMTDPDTLMEDWEDFWKKIKYAYKDHKLEYVAIAEPQERGAWHLHVFIKSDRDHLFISNRRLVVYVMDPDNPSKRLKDDKGRDVIDRKKSLWPWGRTSSERLKGDDSGQYYIAYFTNVLIGTDGNGNEHFVVKQKGQKGLKQSKKAKKGSRIPMYPRYMKIFRCSRGVIRPTADTVKYETVTAEYRKTKDRAIDIIEGEKVINTMQFESFKKIPSVKSANDTEEKSEEVTEETPKAKP